MKMTETYRFVTVMSYLRPTMSRSNMNCIKTFEQCFLLLNSQASGRTYTAVR
uniref:Uncharacterized protein n=1 Tax=Octopus bimaculoides TaxID=37653 RepID=A0A0L8I1Q1_OCTBM